MLELEVYHHFLLKFTVKSSDDHNKYFIAVYQSSLYFTMFVVLRHYLTCNVVNFNSNDREALKIL